MNPFRDTIVSSPWEQHAVDVPGIHGQVLDDCLKGVDVVRDRRRSAGLLIHGEAGSGKTHLLRRLRERLSPVAPIATDRRECLYVWVRLQTSPRMIWRTLRRTLVEDWFRPVLKGYSQFDRILFHRLAEIRVAEGDLEPWYEYMREEHPDGLAKLIDQIADNLHLDRNTAVAFQHIAFGRHRRELQAWLAGTSLPQAALERLDMALEEGTDEEREDQAREVVLMLCRLAGNGLPVVLSFDQVEALQMGPDDKEALFSFGQLISTLHDTTSNVLIISSVQSSFATVLKERARHADYARMTSLGALSLHPLNRSQAQELIAARLEATDGLPSLPGDRAPFWPLEAGEFDLMFSSGAATVSPRRLLMTCAERYETWLRDDVPGTSVTAIEPPRGVELIVEKEEALPPTPITPAQRIEAFLSNTWDATVEEKQRINRPEHTEDILRHGLPLLAQLTVPEARLVRDEHVPDCELVFETAEGRTGVSVCAQSNMKSLSARTKRLLQQQASGRLQRLVLVRDSRVPLSEGAKKARENLSELEARQAIIQFPSVELLAAIDALRALLSDAKSGDLNCDTDSVGPQTVAEWLTRSLSAEVRDFVQDILGSKPDGGAEHETKGLDRVLTLLAEQPIRPIEEVAAELHSSAHAVTQLVQRFPDHLGVLGEPPALVFRVEHEAPRV